MNKIIVASVLLFFTLSGYTCKEKPKIEKITFHYADLEIETPFQVSCNDFENLFSGTYKTIVVSDNRQLKEFEDYLANCDVLDSLQKMDVRIKVFITYANKKTSVLCMDRFNALILDNKSIKATQNIISFIKRQTIDK